MKSCLCVSSKVALLCLYVDIYVRIFHFYFTELHTTFFFTSLCRYISMCVDMRRYVMYIKETPAPGSVRCRLVPTASVPLCRVVAAHCNCRHSGSNNNSVLLALFLTHYIFSAIISGYHAQHNNIIQ